MRKLTTWIYLVLLNKATNCVCWKQFCANQQPLDWTEGSHLLQQKSAALPLLYDKLQMGWGMCVQMDRIMVGLHSEQQRAEAEHYK